MNLLKRRIASLGMMIVCLGIALSPIAMSALKSPRLAHAITGECAGDCNICGCSPASRATRTCCCWQKISKKTGMPKQDQPDHSPMPSHCSITPAAEHPETHDCCNTGMQQAQHGNSGNTQAESEKDTAAATVFKCGSPCGSENQQAFWEESRSEMLPFAFNSSINSPTESVEHFQYLQRMVSCYREPPDPPPKA